MLGDHLPGTASQRRNWRWRCRRACGGPAPQARVAWGHHTRPLHFLTPQGQCWHGLQPNSRHLEKSSCSHPLFLTYFSNISGQGHPLIEHIWHQLLNIHYGPNTVWALWVEIKETRNLKSAPILQLYFSKYVKSYPGQG